MQGRNKMWWMGFSMSALVVLFLLLDAGMKLAAVQPVLEAGQQIGFPGEAMARKLGALLLICTLLYVWPRTSLLGAILVTAFLGGAVATHVRLGNPLFTHVLFGVYLCWWADVGRPPAARTEAAIAAAGDRLMDSLRVT